MKRSAAARGCDGPADNTPKYGVSSTLSKPLEWNNSHVVNGDLVEEVNKLKQQDGGNIMANGSVRERIGPRGS